MSSSVHIPASTPRLLQDVVVRQHRATKVEALVDRGELRDGRALGRADEDREREPRVRSLDDPCGREGRRGHALVDERRAEQDLLADRAAREVVAEEQRRGVEGHVRRVAAEGARDVREGREVEGADGEALREGCAVRRGRHGGREGGRLSAMGEQEDGEGGDESEHAGLGGCGLGCSR